MNAVFAVRRGEQDAFEVGKRGTGGMGLQLQVITLLEIDVATTIAVGVFHGESLRPPRTIFKCFWLLRVAIAALEFCARRSRISLYCSRHRAKFRLALAALATPETPGRGGWCEAGKRRAFAD